MFSCQLRDYWYCHSLNHTYLQWSSGWFGRRLLQRCAESDAAMIPRSCGKMQKFECTREFEKRQYFTDTKKGDLKNYRQIKLSSLQNIHEDNFEWDKSHT